MVPFDDENYKKFMANEMQDWLKTTVNQGRFHSFDQMEIQYYYAVRPDAKATIVMVHGFCEFFGRYHEVAYDFYDQGFNFFFLELRGHGLSERKISNADLVHVDSFNEYRDDLKCFLDKVVLPIEPKLPKLLFCHSMGGAVGAMFLEKYPNYFKAAVLSSPMLKIRFGNFKNWQVHLLSTTARIMHWQKKPLPNATPFDPDKPDFETGNCALSRARFDYQFELRKNGRTSYTMNGGTYGWCLAAMDATKELREKANLVKVPVLIVQAGLDTMVDNSGQQEFADRAPHCIIRRIPEAKHEIFNSSGETLGKYYSLLFRFFREQAAR